MSPATELLLDRVWSYNESFVPSMDELADAATIVQLCEGVPLSIEMVAARTTVFTLRELRERLTLSLSTLIADSGDGQGTASTGAVVRWSISALNPIAHAALQAASTFRGGFTPVALAGVLGCELNDAAEALRVLLEYALVASTTTAGARRFDVLEVIGAVVRASATEEESSQLDNAHAAYFRSTLGYPAPGEFFPTRIAELVVIAADRSNYRHAVQAALHSNVPLAGELIDLLAIAWMPVGAPAELKAWIEALLEHRDITADRRMSCFIHLLRIDQTENNARADDLFRELHAIAPGVYDDGIMAQLIAFEAIYAFDSGDAAAISAAVSRLEGIPTNQMVAYSLSLARVSHFMTTGNTDELIAELMTFLDWARRDGLEIHSISATQNLIYALMLAGCYDEAANLAMQQLDVVLESDTMSRMYLLQDAGESLLRLGQIDAAVTSLELSVALARGFGSERSLQDGIFRLAAARMKADPLDRDAAFLAGMALASVAHSVIELESTEVALVEDYLSVVRDAADGTPLAAARDAGARAFAESGLAAGAEIAAARGRIAER